MHEGEQRGEEEEAVQQSEQEDEGELFEESLHYSGLAKTKTQHPQSRGSAAVEDLDEGRRGRWRSQSQKGLLRQSYQVMTKRNGNHDWRLEKWIQGWEKRKPETSGEKQHILRQSVNAKRPPDAGDRRNPTKFGGRLPADLQAPVLYARNPCWTPMREFHQMNFG